MIKDSYEPFPEDSVTGLWSELTCNGHTCGVFIVFVSSILHIRRSDDENVAKYAHLARKYAELRYTRMELSGKTRTLAEEDEFPFTPVISQKSRTLAGSRSKSRSRKDRCLVQQSFNNYSEEQEEPETQTTSVSHLDSKAGSRRS